MTTPAQPRELLARLLHDRDCSPQCKDSPTTWSAYYATADAVLAAVTPVIRRQVLDEAESAIFQAGLCNEGTPYDSLSGAILVIRGLQLRTGAAAIARSHSTREEQDHG